MEMMAQKGVGRSLRLETVMRRINPDGDAPLRNMILRIVSGLESECVLRVHLFGIWIEPMWDAPLTCIKMRPKGDWL